MVVALFVFGLFVTGLMVVGMVLIFKDGTTDVHTVGAHPGGSNLSPVDPPAVATTDGTSRSRGG